MLGLFSLYMFLTFLYTVIGVLILTKDNQPVNRLFFSMTTVLSLISCFNAWYVFGGGHYKGALAYKSIISLNLLLFYVLFLFTVYVSGHKHWLNTAFKKSLFAVPLVIGMVMYSVLPVEPTEFAQIVVGNYLFKPYGYGWFYNSYYYLFIYISGLFNIFLMLKWYRTTDFKREKRQALIISISMVAGFSFGLFFDHLLPVIVSTAIDPFLPIYTVVPIMGVGFAMKQYHLMNLNPKNIAVSVFDTMNEGILVLSPDLTINYANTVAYDLLGYDDHLLVGMNATQLLDKSFDTSNLSGFSGLEFQYISSQNESKVLLASCTLSYDQCDELTSLIVIFQDITEMKAIQEEVLEMNCVLEQKVDERTERLQKEIDRVKLIEKNISFAANHDFLTGLPNRRLLTTSFPELIDQAERLVLVYINLDDFKHINDSLGHLMGDHVLIEAASRISQLLNKGDLLTRLSGDEFLLILKDYPKGAVYQFIEEITEVLNVPYELLTENRTVTASLGIACFPEDGKDFISLMKNADIALHAAKKAGKKCSVVCSDFLKAQVDEEYRLIHALSKAVENGEIMTHYQPKVQPSTGEITGFEALCRWKNDGQNMISPGRFIPLAEKTGDIYDIGNHVLRTACYQMKAWIDGGLTDSVMSVNVSVVQLKHIGFIDALQTILFSSGLSPQNLELEITESLLLNNDEKMIAKLNAIKALGVHISMDDFGTEYSSLKYMKFLPIDKVKIDREFVSQIHISYKDEEIIKSTIGLIKTLGFEVIAEGVETKAQVDFLSTHGCDEIQGFYYYKPMKAAKISQLLADGASDRGLNPVTA